MLQIQDALTETFLNSLEASQARTSKASEELSTGYRVTRPSDSPADVVNILHLEAQISKANQATSDLAQVRNEADTAESTMETSVNLLESALQLGMQGTNTTLEAAQRSGLASQVQQLLQQLVSLSQTRVQGTYIFSGDNDQQAQYTLNPTDTTTGVTRNFQTGDTRKVSDILGGTFTTGMTAEEIFDHRNADDSVASDNAFAALTQLSQALENNDVSGVQSGVQSIQAALDRANSALTFYGGVQNRIANSATLASKYQVEWTKELSDERDADSIQAATDLQAGQTQQDAALSARANFMGHSLFDFLK